MTNESQSNAPASPGTNRSLEAALRECEARYQRFLISTTDYVYSVEVANGRAVAAEHSPTCIVVTGYNPEEYAARPLLWIEMVHPQDRAAVAEQAAKSLAGRVTPPLEHRLNHKNGSIRWVRNTIVLRKDNGGRVVAYDGLVTDITDRKRAEEALRDSEQMLEGLFENSPDAIVVVNDTGGIVRVNARAEELFQYPRTELVNQAIELLVPPQLRPAHRDHRLSFSQAPHRRWMAPASELIVQRKDGSTFPADIALSPMTTAHGLLVLAVVRDITDRKRAEAELKRTATELARSNAELEQFASVIAHDLQQPLRLVATHCELIRTRHSSALAAEAAQFLDLAVRGAQQMQWMLRGLLTYSRIGIHPQPLQATDCQAVLQVALARLEPSITAIEAVITHDPLPTLPGDGELLLRLFSSLLDNALKFRSAEPPRVHISAHRAGQHWQFSVRDNGIGLDPQYSERIFRVFQRLHGIDKYPGAGIGLAIGKKIVEHHGGRIWVESQPGAGATFHFTLRAD